MKSFVSFLLLFTFSFASAQSVRFEPNWQIGDAYQLNATTVQKTWDGEEFEETTEFIDPIMSVTGEGYNNYSISLRYTNVLQSKLGSLAAEYDWDVEPTSIELRYKVSKTDGSIELMNYEEAKVFMDKAFEDLIAGFSSMAEEDETIGLIMAMALLPVQQMFESQETMSSYFGEHLMEMLMPFYKDFTQGEELKSVETTDNPFSPGDTLSATYYSSITAYEEGSGFARVRSRVDLDFTPYLEMLKPMIQGMAMGFAKMDTTANESELEEAMAEMDAVFDNMNMEGETIATVEFNPQTGWPTKMTESSEFIMDMGEVKNGRVESTRTTTFTKIR